MPKLRVHCMTISLDGFGAGPNQGPDSPLGEGGEQLHNWLVGTKAFAATHGGEGGSTGLDDEYAAAAEQNIGATIMGRNMFGPVRGPWPDESWRGWWGEDPPFHYDVFVMTHHARPSLPMDGGTTFHFVDGAPAQVLEQAFAAAGGKDVRLSGGPSTVRQFLRAGLVDEMHFAIAPILLGSGERIFETDLAGSIGGYRVESLQSSDAATHASIVRA